ncbi:hypothetical protein BKA60DRAFT_668960 [Fusarium oxysporum]|nr:hypothetical protein BKA60DRAFT_668960 [Fusarium oxysporum]
MATPPRPSTLADNSPQWASGCPTCMAIWLQFSEPESAPDINLGSYEEALSTACPRHKELMQEFVHCIRSEEPNSQSFDRSDLGFRKPRQGFSISISQSVYGSGHLWNLLLVKKDDVPQHPGNGRVLDTDWVDIGFIKKWKNRCISSHGVKCQNPLKKQCVVPGHEPVDYVAISYTYGSHTPPVITSTAFKGLQKPFALATPEFSGFVSPIIRHFMYLTSAIDERYLWADALCVTHYDPKAASEQLRSMGAIYVNAVATIIATDGDSRSGVPGLKGRTIQEYALANRKIIFNNLEIHWVCSCSLWHEELTFFTEIDNELHLQSNIVMDGFPDDSSLRRYLDEYNQRSLSFEEDALPALSSLLSVFSRTFECGFLLCWRASGTKGLQRRTASSRPIESRFESSDFPSWSWLGWKGSVYTRSQTGIRVDSNYISEEEYVEEAFPITEWYTSRLPTDPQEQRRKIRPSWFEKREGYKDFTKPMPPGWKCVPVPENEPRLYPDGCGRYLFEHESMLEPYGRLSEWYYPFPVSEIQESTAPFMPEQTPYLFCDTAQARMSGYQQDSDKLQYLWNNEAKFCDRLGKDIGKLHLPDKETRHRFPENVDAAETGLPVDIVSVCRLKRCSKTWDREHWETRLPIIKEDLYLVLWVEWKDGVAYRLASGEVIAAEWENLGLEKVSPVLG